jgi:LysM repeat protein
MRRWFFAFCAATLSSGAMAAPYTVQAADTLFSIAKKFNVSVSQLKSANKLPATTLKTGQVIQIPERRHTVAKGETLFGIAKQYGSSVDAVAKLNKLQGNTVEIGQVLLVPWDSKTQALFKTTKSTTIKPSSPAKPTVAKTPSKPPIPTKPAPTKPAPTKLTPTKTSSAARPSGAKPGTATTKPPSGKPALSVPKLAS